MRFWFACLCVTATILPAADVTTLEEIVCKVNGDIITRSELEKDRHEAEAQFRSQGLTGHALQEAVEGASHNLLRGRIDRLLLIEKGKELDIKVDGEVTKRLADAQRHSGIADPEKFQQFVREQTGMSYEDYRAQLKDQAYVDGVIRQDVSSKIEFKHDDLQKYYDEHKSDFVRQERIFLEKLYISTEGKDSGGVLLAERKAKDLVARARKGEKFEDLVTANSDSDDAVNGGQMPPMQKGELATPIETALWDKPKGFISDPFKLDHPSGFYVFKVVDHQKAGLADFEEVRNEVENRMFAPKFDPLLRDYLTKLRQQAFLEIKPGYEDSGAAPGKNTAWTDPAALRPETVTKEEVAAKTVKKKLLWFIPVPGTSTKVQGTSSSQ
ncbi:MAG TPA: SurA N-terminal domain-containing protein [Bryobacteraceae bacterium]|nr:SurA N-terminal domain-containing protein [Bryobacteraceae bacterium]